MSNLSNYGVIGPISGLICLIGSLIDLFIGIIRLNGGLIGLISSIISQIDLMCGLI